MYYEKLKGLMGGEVPTVKCFMRKISGLPAAEQAEWYRVVYRVAQTEWAVTNGSYRRFIIALIEKNLQRFLDYLRRESFWCDFVTPVEESGMEMLVIYHLVRFRKKRKSSVRVLALCLLLLFGSKNKISTLCQYWKTQAITAEELLYLKGKMRVNGSL